MVSSVALASKITFYIMQISWHDNVCYCAVLGGISSGGGDDAGAAGHELLLHLLFVYVLLAATY